jgi:sugar (pentulose or hexulose) kinase
MDSPLILTFDVGTQSCRAMLVDKHGNFAGIARVKYDVPFFSKETGYAEQTPNFYLDKISESCAKLKQTNASDFANIAAVTITTIRDTVLCLDENNEPLRDFIVWIDKREAADDIEIPTHKKVIFQLAGMTDTVHMQYRATAYNWLYQNERDIIDKTAKYVMLPTYLNYKLTGRLVDSYANMIGHVPFDYEKCTWQAMSALTRLFCDIPPEKLPDLIAPGDTVGTITEEAEFLTGIPAGLPLITTGSDKGCETLGLSVLGKGKAALSFGTTATVQTTTKKYIEPQQFMPAYPAAIKGYYNPEIQIYSGYWTISWFIREFCEKEIIESHKTGKSVEEILNEHLKDIPPCCEGLVMQPYWTPGITIPNAKGTLTGFTTKHTKYHVYRSIIEGIGFALYEGMKGIEKRSNDEIRELFVAGGGSQSDEICQITADMFGLPVKRIHTHEASGIGSSMIAFVSLGIYEDISEAIQNMVRVKDVFEPNMSIHKKYMNTYYYVYEKIYPRLLPVFKGMKKNSGGKI